MRVGLRRHARFYASLLLAAIVAALVPAGVLHRLLIGSEVLFASYLVTTWAFLRRVGPQDLKRHAQQEDEGTWLILLLALLAVGVSLLAVFDVLGGSGAALWQRVGALAAVPLGWASLHTVFALRYAHLYYAPDDSPGGGLDFGGDEAPEVADFLYYSFTIGMTAQTSDVGLKTRAMRRLTLLHGGVSFLFNTVLIALAVNAALSVH